MFNIKKFSPVYHCSYQLQKRFYLILSKAFAEEIAEQGLAILLKGSCVLQLCHERFPDSSEPVGPAQPQSLSIGGDKHEQQLQCQSFDHAFHQYAVPLVCISIYSRTC